MEGWFEVDKLLFFYLVATWACLLWSNTQCSLKDSSGTQTYSWLQIPLLGSGGQGGPERGGGAGGGSTWFSGFGAIFLN